MTPRSPPNPTGEYLDPAEAEITSMLAVQRSLPVELDEDTARTLRRWLRQRAAITARLEGTDPRHL
ncbi:MULTISPECIES: hypothetical protein [unclassified Streptomyces]|uniref:hypothetical protein n=1 Tax=unclassified Streptomyces TaxID=2593676 RepID=UPI0033A4CDAA